MAVPECLTKAEINGKTIVYFTRARSPLTKGEGFFNRLEKVMYILFHVFFMFRCPYIDGVCLQLFLGQAPFSQEIPFLCSQAFSQRSKGHMKRRQ